MAFSLRLPPALDNEARIRAAQVGVPLNALICFALDLYLRGQQSTAATFDELDHANPRKVTYGGMPLKARSVAGLGAKLGARPEQFTIDHAGVPTAVPMPMEASRRPGKLFSEVEAVAIAKSASTPLLAPLPPGKNASKAERRAYTDYIRASRRNSGAVTL